MKLKKHDYIIIIVGIVVVLITMFLVGFFDKNDKNINKIFNNNKVSILKDYSRFFTLESCIYRYVSYVQSKDSDSLLKILDSDYIDKNNITKNNIFDYVGYLDGMYTFQAKKIYYEKKSNNIMKYYVYGKVIKEQMDVYNVDGIDRYYIVLMDTKNMTYTIEPIDSNIFSEVSNG